MPHANVELVQRVYGAYMRGDREAVRAAFDPGIRWHNSGYDPTAGTLEGPDAVLAYLMGENHIEDYRLEVIDMLASDERVAVVAKTSGRIRDQAVIVEAVDIIAREQGIDTESAERRLRTAAAQADLDVVDLARDVIELDDEEGD